MQTKKELLNEALSLPPIERAELIEELLASFDSPERERIDRLWAQEAEERIDAFDRGEETSIPLNAVFEKINAGLIAFLSALYIRSAKTGFS